MNCKRFSPWLQVLLVSAAGVLLLSSSNCARNQHLVSINIQPGNGTFFSVDPSAFFLYKAYGTYVHPPKTIDITNQVTWQSSNPQVAHFTGPGVVSPNLGCGVAPIWATMLDSPNDIVSNEVSITVDGPASEGCPQSNATSILTVTVSPLTDGNVLSAPAGINCGETGNVTCSAQFSANSSVVLTETPASGHSFLGWSGACLGTVPTCTLFMNTTLAVTATFD